MILRAALGKRQRHPNATHLIRSAQPAGRDQPFHLHLIRRDECGGIFLPSGGRSVQTVALIAEATNSINVSISQKGCAA